MLRPDGRAILLIVNMWFPSILVARYIPYRLRQRVVHIVMSDAAHDVFAAILRANTMFALARLARSAVLSYLS